LSKPAGSVSLKSYKAKQEINMQDLIIFGAGGFGRETALMVEQINNVRRQWNLLGFYDDHITKDTQVDDVAVLGGLNDLINQSKDVAVAIAIADPGARKKISASLGNQFAFPILIHPSVVTGDMTRNKIGQGSILTAGTILTTGIHIGKFVIINLSSTVGHDASLGDYCAIMPGCAISGSVTLGDEVFVGSGARILPGVTVGEKSNIGAGAVVTRSVPSGQTVVGVPAREKS
jgi:sugar O-acyltransferase (sialic acid O-acetyltransferase NeuD family)